VTDWPALPYDEWAPTLDTVHMVFQIMGKVRVALSPREPEWAHIALYVTPRGITTGPVPSTVGLFDVEADFVDHTVVIRATGGTTARVPLVPRPVAEFWSEFTAALRSLGIDAELSPVPQEVPDPIPFPEDTVHHAYDPDAAHRFWRVLTVLEPVFAAYRGAYDGKVSRVHFFWGSADLAVTRFSGEPCSPPPGADRLTRESYDYEQMSVGWWPGSSAFPQPAFYAYGYPKPEGIEQALLDVPGASWHDDLGEFVLLYDDVRTAADPAGMLRAFLDAAFAAVASRAGWNPRLLP
jgi:hypothetical protein